MSQGQFEKAEEIMRQVPLTIPQASIIFNTLGEIFGRRGDWLGSIRNFSRSVTADPTNHIAYHMLAPLLVQVGDLEGYRKHCERALKQFGQTSHPAIAERIAKDCLMLTPPVASLPTVANMADTAIAAGPTNSAWPYFQFVKGLAEYRLGHFASGAEWLKKVVPVEGVPARTAQADAVLAMAEFQLGETNSAWAALSEGIKISETKLKHTDRIDWNDQLIAKFLLREAHTLILGTPPPPDK
jgi:serine/threonine-protein kinase